MISTLYVCDAVRIRTSTMTKARDVTLRLTMNSKLTYEMIACVQHKIILPEMIVTLGTGTNLLNILGFKFIFELEFVLINQPGL